MRAPASSTARLTGMENGAQHTERAAIFYYSKVKDGPRLDPTKRKVAGERYKVTFSSHWAFGAARE
jgi:hypothetical protein